MDFIIEGTRNAVKALYNTDLKETEIGLQETRKEFEGEVTVVTFPLTRISKKSPEQTGSEIGQYLVDSIEHVSKFNVIKGFLNLSLTDSYLNHLYKEKISQDSFGIFPSNGKKVMVEYSSPNTNKPLHLGHVRNNLLGYSVAEILSANGYDVVKANLVNDRGIHICKSMLAWKKYGEGETPESSGLKGDHLVGKYYVLFEKVLREQVKSLLGNISCDNYSTFSSDDVTKIKNFQLQIDDLSRKKEGEKAKVVLEIEKKIGELDNEIQDIVKKNTALMREAQQMLQQWEAGDADVINLWRTMNTWVYAGFDKTYKSLGVDFKKFYYESDTYLLGKDIIDEGLEKGVFYKKEDNSVWIDLTADGLDEKLVLRGDGTSVYITQDLGTAQLKYDDFGMEQSLYVVGNEQDYHFKVLFLILDKLGKSWAKGLYHLSYGMVDLPSGKMKSREGTVVDADDLVDEMIETAKSRTEELGKVDGFSEQEKNELYRMIGLGALKYFLLKVEPKKRLLFDPNESIDFQGHTGPFIQYTHARIRSIIAKAGAEKFEFNNITAFTATERELILALNKYPETLSAAAKEYSPAQIANYIYELAKLYNKFYHEEPILKLEDEELKNFRLSLSVSAGSIIKKGMRLLGINVPERM